MKNERPKAQGAAFVEFIIALPVFCLMFLAIIDLTRYFTTVIILDHAAQQGLIRAQALSSFSAETDEHGYPKPPQFAESRKTIAEEMLRIPRFALTWIADLDPNIQFQQFSHVTGSRRETMEAPIEALILLPGESALIHTSIDPARQTAQWIDHPDSCSQASRTCTRPRPETIINTDFSQAPLERRFPVIVEVRTLYRASVIWFKPVIVAGRAAGYRERFPSFPYPPLETAAKVEK